MSLESVRSAYTRRAAEYIDLLGTIADTAEADQRLVLDWAQTIEGRVLDVGCGPGQWTDFLRRAGIDAEGVDPVPAFIDSARAVYPDASFRLGAAESLGVDPASLGGILAWYSLIHTAPERIDAPLAEFSRCVRPGGGLVLGFCTGPELEAFDHAVTTAYFWPLECLVERVESAGFAVEHTETRTDPGARPHAALVARRRPSF